MYDLFWLIKRSANRYFGLVKKRRRYIEPGPIKDVYIKYRITRLSKYLQSELFNIIIVSSSYNSRL